MSNFYGQYIGFSGGGAAPPPPDPWGDRAVYCGGFKSSGGVGTSYVIDYFAISSLGSASSFGTTPTNESQRGISNGTRGVFMGGYANTMSYITISTTSNTTDFGDLADPISAGGNMSNGRRGLYGGGQISGGSWPKTNVIQFITIDTTGDAADFGDLTLARNSCSGFANATRGVVCSGTTGSKNEIDYVTVETNGNATDFGDMSQARFAYGCASHQTRGVMSNGAVSDHTNSVTTIDYITIATTGNATDFGDDTASVHYTASCVNGTKMVTGGGDVNNARISTCRHVTIDSTGNASNFGGLTQARRQISCTSGD